MGAAMRGGARGAAAGVFARGGARLDCARVSLTHRTAGGKFLREEEEEDDDLMRDDDGAR